MRALGILSFLVAATTAASTARAQRVVADRPQSSVLLRELSTIVPANTTPRSEIRARTIVRAAAATVTGAPKQFRVVTIAVPDAAPRDRDLDYQTESAEDTPLLGATSGTIRAGTERPRPVRITVGIPSRAKAGVSQIAIVRFISREAPGVDPLIVEVPVQLLVEPQRRIEISILQQSLVARPGQRVSVPVRIHNSGNDTETLTLRATAPIGWNAQFGMRDRTITVPMNGVVDLALDVRVPVLSNTGTWSIGFAADRDGTVAAERQTSITILNNASRSTIDGARITLGSAAAGGPWDGVASAYGVSVDGQLTDGIQIAGRFAYSAQNTGLSQIGLSRTGYMNVPPSIALNAATWRVNAGLQGNTFSDLTGVNAPAVGASTLAMHGNWRAGVTAGRSLVGTQAGEGIVAGAQIGRQFGTFEAMLSTTHLDDRAPGAHSTRTLDATGLSTIVPIGGTVVLRNEVAVRRTPGMTGFGIASSVVQRGERSGMELRYLRAPGGSAAFARAASEISGMASRQFGTRLQTNANAWKTSDRSPSFSGITTEGASLGGAVQALNALSLNVEARSYSFGADAKPIRFGSSEKALSFGTALSTRRVRLAGTMSLGEMVRTTGLSNNVVLRERADRVSSRAELEFRSDRGSLQFTAADESNGAGIGLPMRQQRFGAQVDQVTILAFGRTRVTASASAQRLTFGNQRKAVDQLLAAVRVATPAGFNAVIEAERNPFYAALTNGGRTMWSVRLERALHVPRFGGSRTRGVAFRDVNGNGVRDADESPISGLLIRRGTATSITDRDGRFVFSNADGSEPSIDPKSLPMGLVQGAHRLRGKDDYQLAVTSLAPITVDLFVVGPDSAKVSPASLANAVVLARDAAGITWAARAAGNGVHTFDALPPGTYTLALDLSDITEPLRADADLPRLAVSGTSSQQPVRLALRTRELRVRTIVPGGNSRQSPGGAVKLVPASPDMRDLPKSNPSPTREFPASRMPQ